MKQDWFDKKLADRMHGLDSEMDFANAWRRIEDRRNKKKKRIIFFWLAGFALLTCSALVVDFYFSENKNQPAIGSVPELKYTNNIKTPVLANKSQQNSNPENIKPDNTPLSIFNHKTNREINSKNISEKSVENTPSKTNNHLPLGGDKKNISILNSPIQQTPPATAPKKSTSPAPKTNIIPATKKQVPKKIATLGFYVKQIENKHETISVNIDNLPFNKRKNKWGATFSYGNFFRTLNPTSAGREEWVDRRNAIEKPLDAFYADIFFRKYISPKIFLQSGLGYLQQATRLEEAHENNYPETMEDQLIEIIRYADGTEEEVFGEAEGLVTQKTTVTKYQKSRSVLLPFLIGLNLPLNQQSGFIFSMGVAASIVTDHTGMTISENNIPGDYAPVNNSFYKKSGLIYGQGNADYYFRLNKKWKIAGGVQSMISLNNQVKSGNGFEDKLRYLGGRISILNSF